MSNPDRDAASGQPEEYWVHIHAVTWRLHAFSLKIGFVEFILSGTRLRK